MRRSSLLSAALSLCAVAPLVSLVPSDALACGGCFHEEDQPPEQSSVVLAHRMALSISPDVSVLWDQVQYTGAPAEFAWVLPVKPGARIEVASDAWFEALDAATAVRVRPPSLQCAGTAQMGYNYRCQASAGAVGCASSEAAGVNEAIDLTEPEEPVNVVHQGSAGPYETVTLHANEPGVLTTWLSDHGYAIGADIQPVIDAYTEDGFDFIALRLAPDQGVQQMKPVRVIQPGAVTTLPLRMVAAGTGPTVSLTLFILAEGRYQPTNFPTAVRPTDLRWDFSTQSSDYAQRRQNMLLGTSTWLTSYALPGGLFSPARDPIDGTEVQYVTGLGAATTIADAFFDQALSNGEADLSCAGVFDTIAKSVEKVVDPCPPDGGACADVPLGQLDARYFACGPIKDLQYAMTGNHPADVWLTRIEAELPRYALANDLALGAGYDQQPINNLLVTTSYVNEPCEVVSAGAPPTKPQGRGGRELVAGALSLLALLAIGRRLKRRSPLAPHSLRSATAGSSRDARQAG